MPGPSVVVRIMGDNRDFTKALTETQSVAGKVGSSITGTLAGAFKLAATAATAAGVATVGFGVSSFQTAARVGEMNATLSALAKGNRDVYGTMTSTVDSVRKQGIEYGVAQNLVAQFSRNQLDLSKSTDIARVAQDAAVISGQNSSDTLDQLIHGITTQNSLVLRNAGVNVQAGKAMEDYAASIGKSSRELTEAERSQAVLNAVIAAGGPIAGAYAAAMTEPGKVLRSFPRLFDDIKVSVGQGLVNAFGPAILKVYELVKSFSESIREGGNLRPVIDALIEKIAPLGQKIADMATKAKEFIENLPPGFVQNITDKISGLGSSAGAAGGAIGIMGIKNIPILGDLLGGINPIVGALGGMVLGTEGGRDAMGSLMKAIQPLIPPLLKLVDVIARFAGDILQKLLKAVEPIIPPLLKLVTTFVDLAVKALEPLLPPLVDLVQRLLPPIVEIFQKLLDALAPILPKLGELVGVVIDFAVKALEPVIPTLTKLADVLFPALSEVLGFLLPIITDMIKWLEPFAPVLGAIAIAVGIVVAIWWIWNAALTVWAILTSPITIVILAIVAVIAAVIAIVVLVIRNFDTLKDVAIAVWNAIWGAVKAAVDFVVGFLGDMIDFVAAIPGKIWNFLKDVFRPLIDAATGAYNWVKDKVDQLVEFFVSLPDRIGKGISVIKDVILAPFKWVWNKIADGWNSTLGGLEFKVPDWVPFIGGKGWGFPKMPNWNQFGGVYSAPTLIGVGEAGRELVLPETLLRQVMREERPGPAGGGPAVVIENATFAEELDVETFLRRAAWTMATERV